jgi:heme A synthase
VRRYALGLLGLTFCLLIVGGLVHNTRSSLACPDWPLCFGSAFPKMEGGVLVEHSHRLLATSVGLGTIGLLFGLLRRARRSGERDLPRLGALALALVIAQGMLGGLTVLYRLPTLVSTAHLAVSMLFFSLLILINLRLRPPVAQGAPPQLVHASAIAAGALYLQMLMGALMRHLGAGLACTDLPLCRGGLWPRGEHPNVLLHAAHRLMAPLVLLLVAWVAVLTLRTRLPHAWKAMAVAAPFLVIAQATLGWLSISTFLDAVPVTAHLAVAALLLADLVALHLVCRGSARTTARRQAAAVEEPSALDGVAA